MHSERDGNHELGQTEIESTHVKEQGGQGTRQVIVRTLLGRLMKIGFKAQGRLYILVQFALEENIGSTALYSDLLLYVASYLILW